MLHLPTIHTRRLLLRPFGLADASPVQALAGDPAVALATTNIPHPYEDGMAEAWIRSHERRYQEGSGIVLAVEHPEEGLVGAVSLAIDWEHQTAELAYWIGRPFWGDGYATEASAALLEYGFRGLGLRRIHAQHRAMNPTSGRVMEKLGMRKEGVLRQHRLHRGRSPEDVVLYGILREEFAGQG